MKLLKTKIEGPIIIKTKIFNDNRGYLKETYRKNILNEKNFPFDVMSFSKKNVLRGLHIQSKKKTSQNNNCDTWQNIGCCCGFTKKLKIIW